MAEGMEAQLQMLTELVQQLQAENVRLREETGQREGGVSGQAPLETVSIGPAPETSSSSTLVSGSSFPVLAERYVYVPRERKCPRFSGKTSQDLLGVEDWIEEVRSSLNLRKMSDPEQVFFVVDLLEGEAKAEIKFRTPAERDTAEKIFLILLENFGCPKSCVGLQTQFFQRKQMEGESLREYSHALMSLVEAIKRRDPTCLVNPDFVLRDQFVEHVRDHLLRRELKRQVRMDHSLTFLRVRMEAIQWIEEGERSVGPRPRAHSYSAQGSMGEVLTKVVSVESLDELSELKECLRKQQIQLDTIMKRLETPVFQNRFESRAQSRFPYQSDGKPICIRCKKPGHIARFCNLSQNVMEREGPRTVGHSIATVAQSEN